MNLRAILRFTLIALAGNAFSKALLLGTELYLAASLGAEPYGLLAIGLALVVILGSVCLLGLNYGLVQFVAVQLEKDRLSVACVLEAQGIAVAAISALVIGIVLSAAAPLAAPLFRDAERVLPILQWVALVVPAETLSQATGACLKARRRFTEYVVVWDLARSVCLALLIPAQLAGIELTLDLVLRVYLAGSVLCALTGIALVVRHWTGVDRVAWREGRALLGSMLRFSVPLAAWGMLQKSANRLFVLFSGFFLPLTEVGVAGLATRLMLALNLFQTAVNASTPGEFARLHAAGQRERIRDLYRGVVGWLTVFSAAATLPLFASPQFVLSFMGPEFAAYWWAMVPLVAAKFANVSSGPAGNLLIACRRGDLVLRVTAIDLTLQFILVAPCLMLWGLAGGVAAEATRMISVVLLRHAVSRRHVSVPTLQWGDAAVIGLVLALGAAVGWAASPVQSFGGYAVAVTASYLGLAPLAWYVLRRDPGGRSEPMQGSA